MPEDYALELPFVCVESAGGIYEDESFVAGYTMGLLDQTLSEDLAFPWVMTMYTTLYEQADLIAMRRGYSTTYTRHEGYPEWITVQFSRSEGLPDGADLGTIEG